MVEDAGKEDEVSGPEAPWSDALLHERMTMAVINTVNVFIVWFLAVQTNENSGFSARK